MGRTKKGRLTVRKTSGGAKKPPPPCHHKARWLVKLENHIVERTWIKYGNKEETEVVAEGGGRVGVVL